VNVLKTRSDDAGTTSGIPDVTSNDLRLLNLFYNEGVGGTEHWKVKQRSPQSANMSVDIGTGDGTTDLAIVYLKGSFAGRGAYAIGLTASAGEINLVIDAADGLPRWDEVFLIVQDNQFGGGSITNARLGYRSGDATQGLTPQSTNGRPGPDSSWNAWLRLARIFVPASATSIVNSNIIDTRPQITHSVDADSSYAKFEDLERKYTSLRMQYDGLHQRLLALES